MRKPAAELGTITESRPRSFEFEWLVSQGDVLAFEPLSMDIDVHEFLITRRVPIK